MLSGQHMWNNYYGYVESILPRLARLHFIKFRRNDEKFNSKVVRKKEVKSVLRR